MSVRIISPFATVALLAMALLLTAATVASVHAATRDHRGSNGAPQGGVTVNGKAAKVTAAPKLGGDKFKGGFEQLKGDGVSVKGSHGTKGPTIRDHR